MPKGSDPFYNRKPVPDEFIEHVGYTGLSKDEEFQNRERKYSRDGGDLRKFSNPKGKDGRLDPHYARKQVSDAEIAGVGDTGLSREEEFLNRERKYSATGVDIRKFGSSSSSGFHPSDDPYYGRKAVNKTEIIGVGETGYSKAEDFEVRENKAAMFDLDSDPFSQVTGRGHRASVSAAAGPGAAEARRRSSAVAPHHAAAAAHASHGHHSGHDDHNALQPIPSNVEDDVIRPSTDRANELPNNHTTTNTTTTTTTHAGGADGHTHFYNEATRDLDNVAPDQRV